MSFHVFFAFSSGLKETVRVPKGTKDYILKQIAESEDRLNLVKEVYNGHTRWCSFKRDWDSLTDEQLCDGVESHNRFVIRLFHDFDRWFKNPPKRKDSESLSPKFAEKFWYGLEIFNVPLGRWTPDYYIARMNEVYDAMRGRDNDAGMRFDAKALTIPQAAAVINLFSKWLDEDDRRLDVPNGHDHLASSYDGGYYWCEKCGAVDSEDWPGCRKRKCPLKEEFGED